MIVVDGDFGPKTEAVLKQYQHDHQLAETGIATAEVQQFITQNNTHATQLSTGSFLHKGDSGAGVVALQQALIAQGIDIKADGVFGDKTLAALKAFQQAKGLDVDGIAGPQTFAALNVADV